jgi:predicted Fe-Mo cluster-binding NifX family protein
MPSLRRLRLTNTRTTDASIQALAASKTLKVLAVTKAGADALAPLRRRGVRIYEASDGP